MKYFLFILLLTSAKLFALKKYYPEEQHKIVCLKIGPEILEAFDTNSEWNKYANLLAVAWAVQEFGWKRFHRNYYNKKKNYCYWGFMKDEKSTACSEKTVEEGVVSFLDYLEIPHTKDNKVKYRAKSCAPYRRLIDEFKNNDSLQEIWNPEKLNEYLRSSNYSSLPDERYIKTGDIKGENGKAITGEAPCAYNSVAPNYGEKILKTLETIRGMCPQIYEDIYSKDLELLDEIIPNRKAFQRIENFWERLNSLKKELVN